MKIRGGFACIVSLMALMVVVIVAGRTTPTNSAELASSENLTVAAADGHDHTDSTEAHDHADGTDAHGEHADGTEAHGEHADGTEAHGEHADGTEAHGEHADGTAEHEHVEGTPEDPAHCHTDCGPGTTEDPNHEHPIEPAIYTQTQLDLLAATQAWISPRFDDVNAAIAAGYVSIGDSGTGFEHYVNNPYLNSPQVLTPTTVEALVYQVSGQSRTLVSGMYLLPIGQTMNNVPAAFNTPQTPWHIHSNLCWTLNPLRVAGITSTGQVGCAPGTTYFVTPPMLHAWLTEQTCGWFSDLDQVTSGDCAAHPH